MFGMMVKRMMMKKRCFMYSTNFLSWIPGFLKQFFFNVSYVISSMRKSLVSGSFQFSFLLHCCGGWIILNFISVFLKTLLAGNLPSSWTWLQRLLWDISTQIIRQQDLLINLELGQKSNDFEGSHSWPVNQRHINFINKVLWSPYLFLHQRALWQQNPSLCCPRTLSISGFCNTFRVQMKLCPQL